MSKKIQFRVLNWDMKNVIKGSCQPSAHPSFSSGLRTSHNGVSPCQLIFKSRGCLGCCSKLTPIIAVDEPSKGLKIQGRTVKKPSFSEEFLSTGTYEMDNSGVQSQRSISSISTSTQTHDLHGAGSSGNPSEFMNHGLLLWNQARQQWLGNRRPETHTQKVPEPRLSSKSVFGLELVDFGYL